MPVLMSTAITEVRALLNESAPAFWTDAQLQSWINQGCEDVARRAEVLWQEAELNVVADQQLYAFPLDFLTAHRAEFSPTNSTQTYSLEYRAISAMDEIWGILHSLPAAWPQYFTIRGNSATGYFLMLYPSPGQTGQLTVYYYRQAVAQTKTTGPIDTQSGWEDIIYDYAVFKALRASKDPTWQQAFQMYSTNLGQLIDKTRNMTDQGNVVTSGIANWPTYTYADNGGW
jgi:hypothetical protein